MPSQPQEIKARMRKLWNRLRASFLEEREESGVEALLEIAVELREKSHQHFYASVRKVAATAGRPENADGTPLSHFGFSLLCEFRGLEIPAEEWPRECMRRLRANNNPRGARDLLAFLLFW